MSAIDRISINPTIQPVTEREGGEGAGSGPVQGRGEEFSTALDHLVGAQTEPLPAEKPSAEIALVDTNEFDNEVENELKFSRHASARLKSRGIELSSQDLQDLSEAVDRLETKNARESLLLLGDHAFIVGIPKRTVITAMPRQEAIGSIFTNIDSTLVVR